MKKLIYILFCLIIWTCLFGTGCQGNTSSSENPPLTPDKNEQEMIKQEVVLYFGDDQAMYLIPEKRTISHKKDATTADIAALILKEIVAGPQSETLRRTIPPEARLLNVKVEGKIAYADFTKEIITMHWGGSAGETMTITSIVNSLTELPEIDKVQILIEGEAQDSLVGHWYIREPIERNESIIQP
ncbi:MAG: GerMN domain-containing protein [Syntrophomonadaceae bacterium]|jgi:germination protein M